MFTRATVLALMALTGLAAAEDPCYIASFPPDSSSPEVIENVSNFGDEVGNVSKFNLIYAEGYYPAPLGYDGGITLSGKDDDRVTFYNTNKPGTNNDLRIGVDPETGSTTTLIVQKPEKTNRPFESEHGGTMIFDLDCPSTVEYIEFQDTEKFPYITFKDEWGELLNENGVLRGPKLFGGGVAKVEKGFNGQGSTSFEWFDEPPYQGVVSSIHIKIRGTAAVRSIKICPVCPH